MLKSDTTLVPWINALGVNTEHLLPHRKIREADFLGAIVRQPIAASPHLMHN